MNEKIGEIEVELGLRECPACRKESYFWRCDCGGYTSPKLFCTAARSMSEALKPVRNVGENQLLLQMSNWIFVPFTSRPLKM